MKEYKVELTKGDQTGFSFYFLTDSQAEDSIILCKILEYFNVDKLGDTNAYGATVVSVSEPILQPVNNIIRM